MILNMTGQGGGQPLLVTETYDTNGGIIYSINTHKTPIQLQAKTVTPTSSIQTINPDTGYDGMSQVIVNAATGSTINNQNKTVSPSTSLQSITADSGYTGLGTVTINAMPSLTLPTSVAASATSGYTKKATVGRSTSTQYINIGTGYNATGGYYEISAVANGTEGTPTASKGTVSNHSISVTPSVTNTTGYITGSTISGTAVSVSASELVSGNKEISSNGTNIDVTNYATVSVSVPINDVTQDQDGYIILPSTGDGSGSGSGGDSLEYEEGTVTIASNTITDYDISFSNTHTKLPSFYVISQVGNSTNSSASIGVSFSLTEDIGTPQDENYHTCYGIVARATVSTSGSYSSVVVTRLTAPSSNTTDNSISYPRYWATETRIRIPASSSNKLGGTYKWMAVWR